MKRAGNAANRAWFLRHLHFAVEKYLAYRTENGALYGRPNACRQRLQQLEVGASLAFILARVAAWARNIIRRRYETPVSKSPNMAQNAEENSLVHSPSIRLNGCYAELIQLTWPLQWAIRSLTMSRTRRFTISIVALCSAHVLWSASQPAFSDELGSTQVDAQKGLRYPPVVRQPRSLLCDSRDASSCFSALARQQGQAPPPKATPRRPE
jgi:hypothetical protein